MRRRYMQHVWVTQVLLALGSAAVYLALQVEWRRHGEGTPEYLMVFTWLARTWLPLAWLVLAAGALALWLRARHGVSRGLHWGLALSYLPLLLLVGVGVLIAAGAVLENLRFAPAILLGLGLSFHMLLRFPRRCASVTGNR